MTWLFSEVLLLDPFSCFGHLSREKVFFILNRAVTWMEITLCYTGSLTVNTKYVLYIFEQGVLECFSYFNPKKK